MLLHLLWHRACCRRNRQTKEAERLFRQALNGLKLEQDREGEVVTLLQMANAS